MSNYAIAASDVGRSWSMCDRLIAMANGRAVAHFGGRSVGALVCGRRDTSCRVRAAAVALATRCTTLTMRTRRQGLVVLVDRARGLERVFAVTLSAVRTVGEVA